MVRQFKKARIKQVDASLHSGANTGIDLQSRSCLLSRHFGATIIATGQAGPSLAARFAARGHGGSHY